MELIESVPSEQEPWAAVGDVDYFLEMFAFIFTINVIFNNAYIVEDRL